MHRGAVDVPWECVGARERGYDVFDGDDRDLHFPPRQRLVPTIRRHPAPVPGRGSDLGREERRQKEGLSVDGRVVDGAWGVQIL